MTDVAKTCPRCGPGTPLTIRRNGETGTEFLGCPNYARYEEAARCTYTEPLPLDMQLRRQGAAGLPGF